jgi:hypothetical protein
MTKDTIHRTITGVTRLEVEETVVGTAAGAATKSAFA